MTHRMVKNVRVINPARARWVKLDQEQAAAVIAGAAACIEFQAALDRLAKVCHHDPPVTDLPQVAKELRTISQQFLYSTEVES